MENIMKYRHLLFSYQKVSFLDEKTKDIYISCIFSNCKFSENCYIQFSNIYIYIYLFIGVSGSIVAVLALAVLYECAKGLNVHLRSPIKDQNGRVTVMKNRIYSEDIK